MADDDTIFGMNPTLFNSLAAVAQNQQQARQRDAQMQAGASAISHGAWTGLGGSGMDQISKANANYNPGGNILGAIAGGYAQQRADKRYEQADKRYEQLLDAMKTKNAATNFGDTLQNVQAADAMQKLKTTPAVPELQMPELGSQFASSSTDPVTRGDMSVGQKPGGKNAVGVAALLTKLLGSGGSAAGAEAASTGGSSALSSIAAL